MHAIPRRPGPLACRRSGNDRSRTRFTPLPHDDAVGGVRPPPVTGAGSVQAEAVEGRIGRGDGRRVGVDEAVGLAGRRVPHDAVPAHRAGQRRAGHDDPTGAKPQRPPVPRTDPLHHHGSSEPSPTSRARSDREPLRQERCPFGDRLLGRDGIHDAKGTTVRRRFPGHSRPGPSCATGRMDRQQREPPSFGVGQRRPHHELARVRWVTGRTCHRRPPLCVGWLSRSGRLGPRPTPAGGRRESGRGRSTSRGGSRGTTAT